MKTKPTKVLIGGQEARNEAPLPRADAVPTSPSTTIGKVYINGHEAVHAGCGGMATAFPDVCLCPPGPPAGPVPVPYTLSHDDGSGRSHDVFTGLTFEALFPAESSSPYHDPAVLPDLRFGLEQRRSGN